MSEPRPQSNTDYLWDRSGPAEPELLALEAALGTLRHRGAAPAVAREPRRARRVTVWAMVGVAAAIMIAVVVWWPTPRGADASWAVEGATRVARRVESSGGVRGEVIETQADGGAVLVSKQGGVLHMSGGTRVRAEWLGPGQQVVTLEEGTVYSEPSKSQGPMGVRLGAGVVTIWPGTACLVRIGPDGVGVIEVKSGRVDLPSGGRVGNAMRVAVSARGLGLPTRTGVSAELAGVLVKMPHWNPRTAQQPGVELVRMVAGACTPDDEVTLWNLAACADSAGRQAVMDRLRLVSKRAYGLDTGAIVAGDRAALDGWWDALNP